mgnify:CR=1 FL=1
MDKSMCTQQLTPFTYGMVEEIPQYGPECATVSATQLAATEAAGASSKATETRLSPTDIVIWLMFGILLALAVSHFRQFCEDR